MDGHADEGREEHDAEFARLALPLLSTVARVADALTHDPTDAQDLVQDTYLRAYRHWHTFVPGSDCRRWLAAICRNTWFAQRARRRWVTPVGDELELETYAAVQLHKLARDQGTEDMFARVDLAPAIHQAIAALPDAYRAVVQLVDVDDFRYEDAAELLGIPVGTVRSRLYRARRELQATLVTWAADAGLVPATGASTAPPHGARETTS